MKASHSIIMILLLICSGFLSCDKVEVCAAENFVGQWEGKVICNTNDDFISIQISQLSEDSLSIQYDSFTLLTSKDACIISGSYENGTRSIDLSGTKNDTLLIIQINDTNFLTKSCFGNLQLK